LLIVNCSLFIVMLHSLLSRFSGGLVGQLIGESVLSNDRQPNSNLAQALKLNQSITESLINYGKIDWDNICIDEEIIRDWQDNVNSGEAAIATFPIALFFHESPDILAEVLEEAGEILPNPEVRSHVLLWLNIIALALREQLDVNKLIPQILNQKIGETTALQPQLEEVQILLKSPRGLQQVVTHLSRQYKWSGITIALAIYCFSCTPEDFRLCVLRAMRIGGTKAGTIVALTGALAGVYNGISAIPVTWRLKTKKEAMTNNVSEQVEKLFAVWAGVYDPHHLRLPPTVAVASPMVIQPRSMEIT